MDTPPLSYQLNEYASSGISRKNCQASKRYGCLDAFLKAHPGKVTSNKLQPQGKPENSRFVSVRDLSETVTVDLSYLG
jgi:hypothetical protein